MIYEAINSAKEKIQRYKWNYKPASDTNLEGKVLDQNKYYDKLSLRRPLRCVLT